MKDKEKILDEIFNNDPYNLLDISNCKERDKKLIAFIIALSFTKVGIIFLDNIHLSNS